MNKIPFFSDPSSIALTKRCVSFADVNEMVLALAFTAWPIEVSGRQTWLASSDLRKARLAEAMAAVYSIQFKVMAYKFFVFYLSYFSIFPKKN